MDPKVTLRDEYICDQQSNRVIQVVFTLLMERVFLIGGQMPRLKRTMQVANVSPITMCVMSNRSNIRSMASK